MGQALAESPARAPLEHQKPLRERTQKSQIIPNCTFDLSSLAPGATEFTPITTGGSCPKLARNPDDGLVTLATAGLPPGNYVAKLEIYIDGTPAFVTPKAFRLN